MMLFDRNSLVTRILALFIILNMLSIFVFIFYIVQGDRYRMERNVEGTIREIATEKAAVISMTMNHVANEAENLALWTMEFIGTEQRDTLAGDYVKNADGALYRQRAGESWSKNHSGVFFPGDVSLTAERVKIINATERLEAIFQMMYERASFYQWSYVATEEGLLRIYPYSGIEMYDPYHQQKEDPFYVVANPKNNPYRKTVWSKPYMDYLGTGWMVTCSRPLYRGNEFFGVACIDVRLDTLQKQFLADFRLSDSGFAYVLDRSGGIIYHPNYLPQEGKQGQLLLANIIKDYPISENYRNAILSMLADPEEGLVNYYDEKSIEKRKLIAYVPIHEQDWILAVEVDYNDFMAMATLEPTGLVVYIALVSAALILFSVFLYRQYTKPIRALRDEARNIAAGNYNYHNSPSESTEIKALSDAFNVMSGEIKEYTDNLIRKNKQIKSILDSIGGLLMIINTEYEIVVLNEKGRLKIEECGEKSTGEKCYHALLERNSPCQGCKVHEVILSKMPAHTRMAIRDEIISNSYFPILNNDKEVVEVVVYSQRVTKSVLMEKVLTQKEKLAGIGQISSAIAHELKTPLAVIKGASYLLDVYTADRQDPLIQESIATISSVVDNAQRTIYNLLDYSGIGKDTPEQIDVTKMVNQILFLSNRERIQKNINVHIDFTQNPLWYYGLIEPLKTSLQNIIANGINALGEGGTLIIRGDYTEDGKLLLEIEDNGCGIPREAMGRLFDPFFTTDTTGQGTGLGLWITRMMVEKMNGALSVRSEPGEGTIFSLLLPLYEREGGTAQ